MEKGVIGRKWWWVVDRGIKWFDIWYFLFCYLGLWTIIYFDEFRPIVLCWTMKWSVIRISIFMDSLDAAIVYSEWSKPGDGLCFFNRLQKRLSDFSWIVGGRCFWTRCTGLRNYSCSFGRRILLREFGIWCRHCLCVVGPRQTSCTLFYLLRTQIF